MYEHRRKEKERRWKGDSKKDKSDWGNDLKRRKKKLKIKIKIAGA